MDSTAEIAHHSWNTLDIVPVAQLKAADSPRLGGEDSDHVRLLSEVDTALPPILVHRQSMRIVDGMHRLRATQLRGDAKIRVEWFDGTELEAFVRAVQMNVTHGLPLTLADREAAATRILESSDSWSDRMIAEMTGLSAPTISRIRARSLDRRPPEPVARIGRDGRVRPLSSAAGRNRASKLIEAEPDLSLREVARRAGISVGTVRDVRLRLSRGADPVPARFYEAKSSADSHSRPSAVGVVHQLTDEEYTSNLNSLQKDPALRFIDNGRFLLRWLSVAAISRERRAIIIKVLPKHNKARIALLAKYCSLWWEEFARDLEQQSENNDMFKSG